MAETGDGDPATDGTGGGAPALGPRELFHSLETRALPLLGAALVLGAPAALARALWLAGERAWAAGLALTVVAAGASVARDVARARAGPATAAAGAAFAAAVLGACWRLL